VSCSLQLRLGGDLVDFARVMRVLRRHRVRGSRVTLRREGSPEVTTLMASIPTERRSRTLAAALARVPAVVEAVILGREDVLVAYYFAHQKKEIQ
jgi:hypothetical protein